MFGKENPFWCHGQWIPNLPCYVLFRSTEIIMDISILMFFSVSSRQLPVSILTFQMHTLNGELMCITWYYDFLFMSQSSDFLYRPGSRYVCSCWNGIQHKYLSLFYCYNALLIIFLIALGSPVILLFGILSSSFINRDHSY